MPDKSELPLQFVLLRIDQPYISSAHVEKTNHKELELHAGIQFKLIVDAATMAASQIPLDQLSRKNAVGSSVH